MISSLPIRIIEARFNLPLKFHQIRRWRGAIAEWAGHQHEIFHNHDGEADYHYRYPMIQYRTHHRKAALMAVNEGVDALHQLLQQEEWNIIWDGQLTAITPEALQMNEYQLQLDDKMHHYRIRNWMALNTQNYKEWREMETFEERVQLLNRILPSSLIRLANAFEWQIPGRFEAYLTMLDSVHDVTAFGNEVLAFNVSFASNIVIPPGLALGKSISHGFGVVTPKRRFPFSQRPISLKKNVDLKTE